MLFWVKYAVQKIRRKPGAGFGVVFLALLVSLIGNATCYYYFDGAVNPDLTVTDALWYSVVSISTVGYGDFYAVTPGARVGAIVFIMLLGLSSFSAFLGLLVERMLQLNFKELHGMAKIHCNGHILIINFPDPSRVYQIIEEIKRDSDFQNKDVVVVTDVVDTLPFDRSDVFFVSGSPLQADVLERAGVGRASMAMVLADPRNSSSDGVVAAIINLIEHLHPQVKTVAECLDPSHEILFRSTQCDSIIYTNQILNNLLVQEVQDVGVGAVLSDLTANGSETALYSCSVEEACGRSYTDLAKTLIDQGMQLISVTREGQHLLDLNGLTPQVSDLVVYIGRERLSWPEVSSSPSLK